MRKNILLLFFSMACMNLIAQTATDTSKHLSFKSVPIDGSLKDYVAKMKKAGFSLSKSSSDYALLSGDFAGYKDCIVEVATLTHKDLVNKITVSFNACLNWASLLSNYITLKDLLTEKYGKPAIEEETFQGNISDSDDNKFYSVKLNRCKYYSTFNTNKGNIHLEITQYEKRACFIKLTYTDKLNNETIKKVALGDL